MIECLGRLGKSLVVSQDHHIQSNKLALDHKTDSHSLLNADAPPFDASKFATSTTDNILQAIAQHPLSQSTSTCSQAELPIHSSTVSYELFDHTCLLWDGESEYFYNTKTREAQPIPFVPLGLSPFADMPQREMFLVPPENSIEDIHRPSYIKWQDIYKDHYEFNKSTRENTEPANLKTDMGISIESRSFDHDNTNAKVARSHRTSQSDSRKLTQTTAVSLDSCCYSPRKLSVEKLVIPSKTRKSGPKESLNRRFLKTILVLPLHADATFRRHAHSISVKRVLLCENTLMKKKLTTVHFVNYNKNIKRAIDSFTTKGNRGRNNGSNVVKKAESLKCGIPVARDPENRKKCERSSEKSKSSKSRNANSDSPKYTEWIDTTPNIRIGKSKAREHAKCSKITKKNKSKDTIEFDKVLHCISLASKQENKIQPKSCKIRTINIQVHRDYVSIIEKADACRKNPAARILLLQQALPLAEQAETISEINNRLVEMAELYIEVGEYMKAQEHAERVLNCISKNVDDHCILNLSARCLVVIGRTYESLVQPDRAKPYFDEALQVVKLTGNRNFEASVMGHLGIVHELMGDYINAFDIYDQTLSMAKDLNNRRVLCETAANFGLAHLSIGELDSAEKILMNNITVARSLRDYVILSRAMTNIAHVHLLKGNLDAAANFHQIELEINEENQDSQGSAQALSCLGNIRKAQKKYEEATILYEEELHILERLGNDMRIMESLGNCGAIHRVQKNVEKAREYHHRERQLAECIGDHVYLAKSIINLADVDITESMMHESCKEILLRTAIERYNISLYLVCEGVSFEDRQLYMVKVGCCEAEWRALDGLESAYRLLCDAKSAVWRADAKHLSIVTQNLRNSFETQSKKHALFPEDRNSHQNIRDQPDLVKHCHEKISNIRSNVSEFIKPKFIDYNVLEIMHQLGIDVLVMYSMFWDYGQEMFAYIMHKSFADWKVVPLIFSAKSSKVLASEHGEYRSLVVGHELDMPLLPHSVYSMGEQLSDTHDSLESCLSYLYDDFFAPLEDTLVNLTNSETLCFVSDGLIANIPFSILQDYRGKFLVERFAISTVPSLELLILLHKRHTEREKIPTNTDVLSLRCSNDVGVHSEVNESHCRGYQKGLFQNIHSVRDLNNAVHDIRANVTILCLPTICEMKDDYTGAFLINGERMSSQDIVEKWKSIGWKTVVFDGMSCFTYRVLHETTVSLTRAFLAIGADRIIGMLWIEEDQYGPENPLKHMSARALAKLQTTQRDEITTLAIHENSNAPSEKPPSSLDSDNCKSTSRPLLEQFVDVISDPSFDRCFMSKALRKFQLDCIQKGISRWEWGRFTIVGLP